MSKPGDVDYLPQHPHEGLLLALIRGIAKENQKFLEGDIFDTRDVEFLYSDMLQLQKIVNALAEEHPEWGVIVDPDVTEWKFERE